MNIRSIMLKNETNLSLYATKDSDAIRLHPLKDDIRPNFFRDIDRIIYTLSYTRYIDKTQVFSRKANDHISKRIIHVQLVSKIARTIGRALSLNEDLIEAIALGHDLGHVPFGHVGERFLDDLSMQYGEGHFMHNVQSVRNVMVLEENGDGKNLCIQTLDGILCHNGEFVQGEYRPKRKTKEDFLNDYQKCYEDKNYVKRLIPMTLEGCVVRISDIIGYLGRDIEDAIRLGVFERKEIPTSIKAILGENTGSIVNTIINDIIQESLGKDYIKMSDTIYQAIKDLKTFNQIHIYDLANTKEDLEHIKEMFNHLFKHLMLSIQEKNMEDPIYRDFLSTMNEDYIKKTTDARKVIDYISGMTDEYFITQYDYYQKKEG